MKRNHYIGALIILEVKNISFNYPNQTYFKGILQVSLKLNEGEVLAIVGKSGCGKTTLIKCIYGLEDLHAGSIHFRQKPVLGPSYNLIPGHEEMRLVSQDYYVLDNHTVLENIHDKLIGYTNEAKEKRSDKLLKLLELTALKHMKAKNLSSGQRQRVAIARALAIIPKLLLLDEPFSNLDKLLNEKLFAFVINEAKKNNTSIILVTHLAEEALKYADRIIVMDNGKIIQNDTKWKVYYKPKNTRLAGLLGAFNSIHPKDLRNVSVINTKGKLFLRPDRLRLSSDKKADLQLKVINCSFNGKCFEVLGETKNGNSVMVYSSKSLASNETYQFKIDTSEALS